MDRMNEQDQAQFTFAGGLVNFLAVEKRQDLIPVTFKGQPAVKHLIESLGIPHTEVHHILVNGQPADLTYHVQPGDKVQVYPVLGTKGYQNGDSDSEDRAIEPRFILDNHLGRLAAYLRMLGFDSLYRNDYQDEELAQVASQENRILLTRDRRLLMRSLVHYGYCVQSLDPHAQIVEIIRRYRLADRLKPFQRCLRCNHLLQPVDKGAILDRLEPLTRQYYNEFAICPACQQIYWKGSHFLHMQTLIAEATGKACQA